MNPSQASQSGPRRPKAPTWRSTLRIRIMVAAASACLLPGCGGDGEGDSSAAEVSPPTAGTTRDPGEASETAAPTPEASAEETSEDDERPERPDNDSTAAAVAAWCASLPYKDITGSTPEASFPEDAVVVGFISPDMFPEEADATGHAFGTTNSGPRSGWSCNWDGVDADGSSIPDNWVYSDMLDRTGGFIGDYCQEPSLECPPRLFEPIAGLE